MIPEAAPPVAPDRSSHRLAVRQIPSLAISCFATLFVLSAFMASSDEFIHWFVIPIGLCGVLIGIDAIDWIRGRLRLFSPIGIVGALGFHFFFLAPLLHVSWNHWMRYIVPPDDWRPWLGGMGLLNLAGLFVYRFVRNLFISKSAHAQGAGPVWQLDEGRFPVVILAALVVAATLQVAVYIHFGGVGGYIEAYENRHDEASFMGMGYLFAISETFPILALMLYAFYARRTRFGKSWAGILIVLSLFFLLSIFFGGLRGSRSSTIWKLFWAVGIIHFWIRPIPRIAVALGVAFLVSFMYLYGFYKAGGRDALARIADPKHRELLEQESGRTIESVLLLDLGRSDVQAFLLYRLTHPDSDYRYAMGRTYLAGAVTVIPRVLWPDRPTTKVKEGTEAQYGMGSFIPGTFSSSRVYGLAGEAMLNFGILAIPFAFAVWGIVVGKVERLTSAWTPGDARWLLTPVLINLSFVILQADSDNVVFFLVYNAALPLLAVFIGSKVRPALPSHSPSLG